MECPTHFWHFYLHTYPHAVTAYSESKPEPEYSRNHTGVFRTQPSAETSANGLLGSP
ncbi:hypothetical protein SCLCIDRAFT_1220910 [Scleroderma citrinum Foug A]|uniref:Uncharacterized protein n=1 Tax=Scleroderma citrinum Foug A TaxID=1036808 RepID=A0A0C2ZT62_9AGAM|nr:hypothetical protein SCLCIDRAFT_1220910 [Scleroderma citrinum Foug A]